MLKRANEVAKISEAVRQQAADRASDAQDKKEQQLAETVALEKCHNNLEVLAQAAARLGAMHVVVPGHGLNIALLERQGFVAKKLTRRTEFEDYLESLCAEKLEKLVACCNRIVFDCDGLEVSDDDALLHRDPLLSLMETLWRRDELKTPFEPEQLLDYLRTLTAANPAKLEAKKLPLQDALTRFEDLKLAESKHRTICWENLTIPAAVTQATIVSWEASEHGGGLVAAFSAQKLQWLTTQWPSAARYFAECIDVDAGMGRFESVFFAHFDGTSWQLSVNWPEDDEDAAVAFCTPSIAAVELQHAGYRVMLEELLDNGLAAGRSGSNGENSTATRTGTAYKMLVQWA
jgi:hypothetical protein